MCHTSVVRKSQGINLHREGRQFAVHQIPEAAADDSNANQSPWFRTSCTNLIPLTVFCTKLFRFRPVAASYCKVNLEYFRGLFGNANLLRKHNIEEAKDGVPVGKVKLGNPDINS